LLEISAKKNYHFKHDAATGKVIFSNKNKDISFRIKSIPQNLIFENKGDIPIVYAFEVENNIRKGLNEILKPMISQHERVVLNITDL
jgi:hypothetical protein